MATVEPEEELVTVFCGWLIEHEAHLGMDITHETPIFKCPGWLSVEWPK